jgi:hypothetical protein
VIKSTSAPANRWDDKMKLAIVTIESVTADSIVTIALVGSFVFNINGKDYPIGPHHQDYY